MEPISDNCDGRFAISLFNANVSTTVYERGDSKETLLIQMAKKLACWGLWPEVERKKVLLAPLVDDRAEMGNYTFCFHLQRIIWRRKKVIDAYFWNVVVLPLHIWLRLIQSVLTSRSTVERALWIARNLYTKPERLWKFTSNTTQNIGNEQHRQLKVCEITDYLTRIGTHVQKKQRMLSIAPKLLPNFSERLFEKTTSSNYKRSRNGKELVRIG